MKIPKRMLVIGLVSLGVLFVAGGGLALAYEVTAKHSDAPIIRSMANILPIPAARIGNKTILYRDYLKSRDTVQTFLKSPAAKAQNLNVSLDATLEQNVLEKMLHQDALEELAGQKNISVTDPELRAYFTDVVRAAASSTQDVGVYLLDNFGWTEEDFRQNVLKPAILEQRLGVEMAKEKQGDDQALATYLDDRLKQKDVVRYLKF